MTSASSRRPIGTGREVASAAGGGVAGEVLERGHDAGALQAPHVRGADRADQVRVLADRLLGAAPAVVAGHVEHRGEALVDAGGAHRPADPAGHLLDQVGVEGRAPAQRGRVDGGPPGREAGEALLVHLRRDAEPAGRHDLRLRGGQRPGAEHRVDRRGAERPGQLAQPVPDDGRSTAAASPVMSDWCGATPSPRGVGADPDPDELGELLLERHQRQERLGPLGRRQPLIAPRRAAPDCPRATDFSCHDPLAPATSPCPRGTGSVADVSHDPKLSGNLRNLFGNLSAASMPVKSLNRTTRGCFLHTVTPRSALRRR